MTVDGDGDGAEFVVDVVEVPTLKQFKYPRPATTPYRFIYCFTLCSCSPFFRTMLNYFDEAIQYQTSD
jgi:hypothetical protein